MLSSCHKKVNPQTTQRRKPLLQLSWRFSQCLVLLLTLFCEFSGSVNADAERLAQASRLLRVTDTSEHFNAAAAQQTREIIRTYTSIVDTETTAQLPENIKLQIAACYSAVYAWENFAAGIALILAESFDADELELLLGFYTDLSVPPNRIGAFKAALKKSSMIEQQVTSYIEQHSDDCQEQSMSLIRDYLAIQNATIAE